MGEKPANIITWSEFTQTPLKPEAGNNPVTKVINMELAEDKSIRTRKDFVTNASIGTPENQIVTGLKNAGEDASLLLKSEDAIYKYDGNAFEEVTTSGLPYADIYSGTNGSFSSYNGEVYYCESTNVNTSALFSYDGTSTRNLGVPAYTGSIEDSEPSICSSQDFSISGICGCACARPGGTDFYVMEGSVCQARDPSADVSGCDSNFCTGEDETRLECVPHMPGFLGNFCFVIPNACDNDGRGEKILNCAFKVGLYDPERNTFGRASDPVAVINFGPNRNSTAMFQYQILASAPAGVPSNYRVAVWCTIGMEVLEFSSWKRVGPFLLTGTSHAMSKQLGGATFLEGTFAPAGGGNPDIPNCDELCLYKDQTLLTSSGQYTGVYDRPAPSKSMCILSNGTAVYFFPVQLDNNSPYNISEMSTFDSYKDGDYLNLSKIYRSGAEYSISHPEQIGRYNSEGIETFSHLSSLRGVPIVTFNDSGSTIILTRQTIYQVGFGSGVQVSEMGGPGILNSRSYHPTSSGVFYVSDEGPVWLRGGKAVEIIRELKFDGWMNDLEDSEKQDITIGLIESEKKIIAYFPIAGTNGSRHRVLMHDIENGFTSEWWVGSSQSTSPNDPEGSTSKTTYMSSFRADLGYQFLLWLGGITKKYDSTKKMSSGVSIVEFWVNENNNVTKQLNEVVIDLGSCVGSITIRVSAFDNPNDKVGTDEKPTEERTHTTTDYGFRNVLTKFMGMRGKFFRIRVESENYLEISKAAAEIQYDDDPGLATETPVFGNLLGA